MMRVTFVCLVFLAWISCSVQAESGACYRSVTRYRIAYRSVRSGSDSYSCGFFGWSRCRRARYIRESYRMSFSVIGTYCCSGYDECVHNSSRCCQSECDSRWTHNCDQICRDTDTSYTCSCRSGYRLASDRHSCNDVDECSLWYYNPCRHNCMNTIGSYVCSCRTGYRLASDGHSCNEINECAEGTHQCTQICRNTVGSYSCSCESEYCLASDGVTCNYNAFLMKPSNSRVVLGDNATFYCQFPGMDVIEWKVNNVSLSEYTDVNINDQIRQNASGNVHSLSILALKSYNETTVKCSARLPLHKCQRRQEMESDTVNLLIQGELEAVTDLNITDSPGQILITWHPPFTFNLTDRPYSVTYCIDIIADSSGKHYVSACNITETQYIFRIVSEINVPLIIIVTPENSLGRGKEQNVSVNNVIYCQHNCHNDYGSSDSEVGIWPAVGGSASVISLFITVPSLVACICWMIKKARSCRTVPTSSTELPVAGGSTESGEYDEELTSQTSLSTESSAVNL